MSNASLEAARVAAPAAPRGVPALRAPEDDTLGCLANASSSADSLFPPRYVRTRRLSDGTLRTFLHLLGSRGNPHRCKLLLAHRHPLFLRVRQRRTTPGARFEPRALSRGSFRPPPPARASVFFSGRTIARVSATAATATRDAPSGSRPASTSYERNPRGGGESGEKEKSVTVSFSSVGRRTPRYPKATPGSATNRISPRGRRPVARVAPHPRRASREGSAAARG